MHEDLRGVSGRGVYGPKRAVSAGCFGQNDDFGRVKNRGGQIRVEVVAMAARGRACGPVACLDSPNLACGQPVPVEVPRILLIDLPVLNAAQLSQGGKVEAQVIAHERKIISGDPNISEQSGHVPVPRRHANARDVEIAHLHRGNAFKVVVFERVGGQGVARNVKGLVAHRASRRGLREAGGNAQPPSAPVADARNALHEAVGGVVIAFDDVLNARDRGVCSAADHLLVAVRVECVGVHFCVVRVEIFHAGAGDQAADQLGRRKGLHGRFIAQAHRDGGK